MNGRLQARLLCGVAAIGLMGASAAQAAEANFAIPPQSLASALSSFSEQSGRPVLYRPEIATSKVSPGAAGEVEAEVALNQLLAGTGLSWKQDGDTFLIVRTDADPQSGSAAGDGADGTVEALIVTAQKREEDIQDVPIAISAFTQEDLTRSQVAGGPDLMTQVPNMTFTKTNFSSYSIQIRGIGTQAISATTDAAVAVAFNNTPFIRNRFFEQEFYDLQRVEVLRGPQGTLYGRNATAGVVNIISAKPTSNFEAKVAGDVANYSSTRLESMLNIPLVEDAVALRLAGAWTKRDGYVENQITGNPIDGRDLWSTRVSLRFAPTDAIEANLIWEHFEEDDDRLRSGKQVCNKHVVTEVGGIAAHYYQEMPNRGQGGLMGGVQATFSQGCSPASMYAPESFQTPNGLSLPYYVPLSAIGLPIAAYDPYVSTVQSRDLRVIESAVDPKYRAKSDLAELQISVDLTDTLTLASETAYSTDTVFSLQDFNRFNTAPSAWLNPTTPENVLIPGTDGEPFCAEDHGCLAPGGGIFCDPQLGCSDRLVAVDLSTAKSRQFSQEFRLSSNFDGSLNFSLGANFLRYDTEDKYYVFINSLTLIAANDLYSNFLNFSGITDNRDCLFNGAIPGDPTRAYPLGCTFIDTNPIGSLNDQGHNYFLSKNPYKLISYAVFGELYYNITDNLKITGGARWTVDKKEAPRIPSWLLASDTVGYPVASVAEQEWRKPTGRLTLDWKPDLSFTDETLVYASMAHGYKAGGANPPGYTFVFYGYDEVTQAGQDNSATRPKTFKPEYVDALEVGTKNTLFDGRVTLNVAGFYYDYAGYQISEIVDRSAFNRNFDAEVWGLEIEADWRPLENLRLGFKGGYENTRLADGSRAVDLMDRTAGHDDWVVVRPFPTFASSCILPEWLFVGVLPDYYPNAGESVPVALGGVPGGNPGGCELAYILGRDPVTDAPYVDLTAPGAQVVEGGLSMLEYHPNYPGWDPSTAPNSGEGFYKDISGNELPNAPNFTTTITADYTIPLSNDWLATLHTDVYYQSEAWTRIFNTEGYDKLKAYTNINLAAIFTNEDAGWRVMAYVKNVFDRDAITGAFLNSDDTGLTTNVFLTEPRLYGIRVTKEWIGDSALGSFGQRRDGPYPFTLELGGQVQRHDAPYQAQEPAFLDEFAPTIRPRNVQNQDLDWGDGREIELAYRPAGRPWTLSLGARFAKTNAENRFGAHEEGDSGCGFPEPIAFACDQPGGELLIQHAINYVTTEVTNAEEHRLVDFSIGRDFGLGGVSSTVKAGLRYAGLGSQGRFNVIGIPDWELPDVGAKYESQHHRYRADLLADREFEGAGPVVSWEASSPLLDGDWGEAAIDWAVTAGALFGEQEASIAGTQLTENYDEPFTSFVRTPFETIPTAVDIRRSASVTVPVLDLSLGLSYTIDRLKVGAGYRWERYFDAIDGGYDEHKDFDRTIDGPYFKLSVGFGG